MRRSLALVAAIAAGSMFGLPAQAGSPEVVTSYVGVVGDLTLICQNNAPNVPPEVSGLGIGGGCYDVDDGLASVNIAVSDDVATNVGFQLGWYDSEAHRVGSFIPGCNSGDFAVPADVVLLRVFVDGPINGPADCATAAPDGVGVLGTITVNWTALPIPE